MQIDWVTVAAQIVNFLVLIWLLRRFLYGPITRAMRRREERIEARLNAAKEKQEDAGREADRLRKQQDEIGRQRHRILEEARRDAQELRERLEKEARDDVNERRCEWRKRVMEEREEFLRELRVGTARHVYELVRSVLAELADADLETQAAMRFADHLHELNGEQAAKLAEAAQEEGKTVLVESSFELPRAAKEKIAQAVHDIIAPNLEIGHARADDLLFGVRLVAGGRTVEWSLTRYLKRLEDTAVEKLAQARSPEEQEAA